MSTAGAEPNERRDQWQVGEHAQVLVDSPAPGAAVYDAAISIAGSVNTTGDCVIHAEIDGEPVGETSVIGGRNTVFRILGCLSDPVVEPRDARLTVAARGSRDVEVPIRLVPAALGERHYGDVVHPANERLLHRENIYGSGPPVEEPSPEAVRLVLDYLPASSSVIDVGCGAGAYGPGLRAAGHQWLGVELNPTCWQMLDRRGLPYREIRPDLRLPCAAQEFDCAICIEVLEHIAEPESFLAEIARVTRRRALFSVPNMEVLPYFQRWAAVPWHLLEADHKNFFTRGSLRALLARHFARVEVFSYGEHPLRGADGIPLHVHLFAIAEH